MIIHLLSLEFKWKILAVPGGVQLIIMMEAVDIHLLYQYTLV